MDAKTGASTTLSYDDFEPLCNWMREEGHQQTLVVHVPDFRRDQLKVHISNHGVLRISGERPIDKLKRSRFSKEIKIPNECDPSKIQAKFSGGRLHIIMPNKILPVTKQDQPTPSPVGKTQEDNLPKPENTKDQGTKMPRINNKVEPGTKSGGRRMNLHVAVAVMAVVVGVTLGAYTTVKYWYSGGSSVAN